MTIKIPFLTRAKIIECDMGVPIFFPYPHPGVMVRDPHGVFKTMIPKKNKTGTYFSFETVDMDGG